MKKLIHKLFILLNCVHGFLAANEISCSKNRTLLEVSGDVFIAVFIDVNEGSYCNETSLKGFQELSTAVHVAHILNKYNYVPDMSIGLRIFDTCHDNVIAYKQALTAFTEVECLINNKLTVLVSESYAQVLRPLMNYSLLQINYYPISNFSVPLMEVAMHFISGKFRVIDLLLTSDAVFSSKLLNIAREYGVCVKNLETTGSISDDSAVVVLAVGNWNDVSAWVANFNDNQKVTWILLSVDDVYVKETLPTGSYYIKSEPIESINYADSSLDNYINATKQSIIHSPYLLNLGKSIIQIAKTFNAHSCENENCTLQLNLPLEDISTPELYETLHITEEARYASFSINQKVDEENSVTVASYKLQNKSCLTDCRAKKQLIINETCVHFVGKINVAEEKLTTHMLRPNEWVIVFLVLANFGTLACILIASFIIYRYFTEDILDGNPTLTVVLSFANIFLLQTVFPFCMHDDYVGAEYLNARKIFITTLSFGILFSIILSRAFFLAFSTGGTLTAHISGYLQSLMIFFMASVQVVISTMYFLLSREDSATVVRGLMFIALLSYDIFLLISLVVISCFIAQVQRNYREGKCFFGTVIGLLIVWAVWLTCFILVEAEVRDIIVCFGIVASGLFVIIGILIPRTYFMVIHLRTDQPIGQSFGPTEFGPDPRMNNTARQYQQPFYEYIRPAEGLSGFSTLTGNPNYYGTSSPSTRYFDRPRLPEPQTPSAYNNYGFHSEMREMENAYVVPRVCIENPEGYKSQLSRSSENESRMQRKPALILREKDCIETDIYMEDRKLSPSRRGPNENYPSLCSSPKLEYVDDTIHEEDEYEPSLARTTKF